MYFLGFFFLFKQSAYKRASLKREAENMSPNNQYEIQTEFTIHRAHPTTGFRPPAPDPGRARAAPTTPKGTFGEKWLEY